MRTKYLEKNPIGAWSISNGAALLLLNIEYGIEDIAIVKLSIVDGIKKRRATRCVIKTGVDGDNYITFMGSNYSFSECMRY